jgi:hypothetical protein
LTFPLRFVNRSIGQIAVQRVHLPPRRRKRRSGSSAAITSGLRQRSSALPTALRRTKSTIPEQNLRIQC